MDIGSTTRSAVHSLPKYSTVARIVTELLVSATSQSLNSEQELPPNSARTSTSRPTGGEARLQSTSASVRSSAQPVAHAQTVNTATSASRVTMSTSHERGHRNPSRSSRRVLGVVGAAPLDHLGVLGVGRGGGRGDVLLMAPRAPARPGPVEGVARSDRGAGPRQEQGRSGHQRHPLPPRRRVGTPSVLLARGLPTSLGPA